MTFTMGQIQYQEWLVPYLEGTLDSERRALLEARLATDSVLASEVEALRSTVGHLREIAARHRAANNLAAPARPDLWPRLRSRLEAPAPARPFLPPRVWWGTGLAAACGLAVVAVWNPLAHRQEQKPQVISQTRVATRYVGPPPSSLLTIPPPPPIAPKPMPQHRAASPMAAPAATLNATGDPFAPGAPLDRRAGAQKPPMILYSDNSRKQKNTPPLTNFHFPVVSPASPPLTNRTVSSAGAAKIAGQPQTYYDGAGGGGFPAAPGNAPASPASTAGGNHQADAASSAVVADENGNTLAKSATSDQPPQMASSDAGIQAPAPMALPPSFFDQASPARAMRRGPLGAAIPNLQSWQMALAQTQQPPQFGTDESEQRAAQIINEARDAGGWNALRLRLEQQRQRQSQSLVLGRCLAVLYEVGGENGLALAERRRVTRMPGASGEDWFQAARLSELAGDAVNSRMSYRRVLMPMGSPAPAAHAEIARQKTGMP